MAILECRGLCKSYGAEPALDRVDLAVEPGRIVGLLGPNGSGKSTLIKLANGLLTPDAGEILIDGMAPSKGTKKIVSYLPERTYFADWMTALQLLDFFGDFYDDFDRAAVLAVLEQNAARATEKAAAILEYPRRGKTGIQPTKAPQTAPKQDGVQRLVDIEQKKAEGRDAECVSGIRLYFPGAVRSRR